MGTAKYFDQARVLREQPFEDGSVVVYFDPTSGPKCMYGTEFTAHYLDRGSDDLLIWLDTGGACWRSSSCVGAADTTADDFPQTQRFAGSPELGGFNVVSMSYCDGSLYAGDNSVQESGGVTRFHHGRRNFAAGLDLAVQHFPRAKRVLLSGSSAGAYGTIFSMAAVRLRYPQAELSIVSDGGPGVINLLATDDVEARLRAWKWDEVMPPSCSGCAAGRGQPAALYGWMLARDSALRVAVLGYERDPVLSGYLYFSMEEYAPLFASVSGELHDAHPQRFRRYVVSGVGHTVLSGGHQGGPPAADGVAPMDWVQAMVRHDDNVWRDVTAKPVAPEL